MFAWVSPLIRGKAVLTTAMPPLTEMKPTLRTRAPAKDWWVEVATDISGLEAREADWRQLAHAAADANVFYEPWLLLPALRTFGFPPNLCGAFVYRRDPRPKQPPQLCGFFPFERRRWYKGLPIRSLRLWGNEYIYLRAPLVHRDWAREALHALFDWILSDERCGLIDLPLIPGDGALHHALLDFLHERGLPWLLDEAHARAFLRRGADAESYCASAMNHLSRKEWRRQRNRLAEQGKLETRVLHSGDNAAAWIEQFLDLESRGWKGATQTALAKDDASEVFFRFIAAAAAERGQLQMLGIFLDDRAIALKCNFLTQDGGFAFKIAYDEAWARHSPGVQVELDNIAVLHQHPTLRWMDSCAAPGHFMINRLWKDRRAIHHLLIATSKLANLGALGLLPMARALKRLFRA